MSSALLRFYDRLRDPASQAAAQGQPTVQGFDALRGHKYCLLVTYRRSGEPVPTPVWFGLDDAGRIYVRTPTGSGKVKRVRADSRVLVGPANARGKPLGPLARATLMYLQARPSEMTPSAQFRPTTAWAGARSRPCSRRAVTRPPIW